MAKPAAVLRISGAPIVSVNQPVEFEVTVRNSGPIVESFSLEVLGRLTSGASFDAAPLNLLPEQEDTRVLSVVAPPDLPAGSTVLAIRAVPASDPTGAVVEELEVSVAVNEALDLRVVPSMLLGSRATAEVEISNEGNAAGEVNLRVTDPCDAVAARFGRASGVIHPGQVARTPLRVQLDRRLRQVVPFTVEVMAEGRIAATAGAQIEPGRRRRILLPALALGLLLIAAGLAVPLMRSDAIPILRSADNGETGARQEPTSTSLGSASETPASMPSEAGAPTTMLPGGQPAGPSPPGEQPTPGASSTVTSARSGTASGPGATSAGPVPTTQAGPAPRQASPPTTFSITPIADTYSNEGDKNANYGGSSSLASRGTFGYVSYLRFAFPAAPSGQSLTRAVLRIHTNSSDFAGSPQPHTVSLASNSWCESELTWNN